MHMQSIKRSLCWLKRTMDALCVEDVGGTLNFEWFKLLEYSINDIICRETSVFMAAEVHATDLSCIEH